MQRPRLVWDGEDDGAVCILGEISVYVKGAEGRGLLRVIAG